MQNSEIRKPVAAGRFYPSSKEAINKQIDSFLGKEAEKIDVLACMLPHAGYAFSGAVAARTVERINIKDRLILLGPNHTGYGSPFSIMTSGTWLTPMGEVNIDANLAKLISKKSRLLEADTIAHLYEHSLEVELPILQYFKPDFEIVPIAILSNNIDELKKVGEDLASAVKESGIPESVMLVASSDMTHYEPQEKAKEKDNEAIKAILQLDEDALMKRVRQLDISMCGCAPVAAMLSAAKALGAKRAELIKYQTSGDTTGDKAQVVGYAGIIIYR